MPMVLLSEIDPCIQMDAAIILNLKGDVNKRRTAATSPCDYRVKEDTKIVRVLFLFGIIAKACRKR